MNYALRAPDSADREDILAQKMLLPFDDKVIDFISAISDRILGDAHYRDFPELMAMAFWMRKKNLLDLKASFYSPNSDRVWLGRGLVFHIAPSNVDTIFVYSWFLSMLTGNVNIVRLSSSGSNIQKDMLLDIINEVCRDSRHDEIRKKFMIIEYGHDDVVTSYFSLRCDVRVIWGGDETISRIRAVPLKPSAFELVFSDRFSFCVIQSDAFLELTDKNLLIQCCYNDTYWFNQLACSSPRVVFWAGTEQQVRAARDSFWPLLERKISEEKPVFLAERAVEKLAAQYALAITAGSGIHIEKTPYTSLSRIFLHDIQDIRRELHCGAGLFFEVRIQDLDDLNRFISEKEQTMAVFGFDKEHLVDFIKKNRPQGVSRIVPIGKALNFSSTWDGYDLLHCFTREITF